MQEVIVYRNPLEAMLWHALEGGAFIPVSAGVLAFFVALWVSVPLVSKVSRRLSRRGLTYQHMAKLEYLSLTASALVGVLVTYVLWL